MDRLLLAASTFCFLIGFVQTCLALRAHIVPPQRVLLLREPRRLPPPDGLSLPARAGDRPLPADQSLRGARLSLLVDAAVLPFHRAGVPALAARRLYLPPRVRHPSVALLLPADAAAAGGLPPNPWLELHAAISVVAYGAFGLAFVAGVMYLAQERQLKTHQLHQTFYQLPPIHDLAVANRRLILAGFSLFTIGMLAGLMHGLRAR